MRRNDAGYIRILISGVLFASAFAIVPPRDAFAATTNTSLNIGLSFDFAPSTPIGSPYGMLNTTSGYTLNPRPKIFFWSMDPNGGLVTDAKVIIADDISYVTNVATYQYTVASAGWSPSLPAANGTTVYYTPQTNLSAGFHWVHVAAKDVNNSWSKYRSFKIEVKSTTTFWTDPTVSTGSTQIRANHVAELRNAVNNLAAFRGSKPLTWTDATIATGTTRIRPVHIQELRAGVDSVLSSAVITSGAWTDSTLSTGTTLIRVIHLEELRKRIALP